MKNKKFIGIAIMACSIFAISCADNAGESYANLSKEKTTTTEASSLVANATASPINAVEGTLPSPNTDNRITVHKGSIETQTTDAKKYVTQLVATINKLGGHTSNYQMCTNQYEKATQDFSTDSMYKVMEQTTKATLTMRIPIKQADSFVQQIMHMDGTILNLQLNEEDKTADYQIADGVDKYITDKPKQFNKYGVDNAIENRVQKNEIAYQTKYFWCDVAIHGDAQIIKKAVLKPSAYRTPLYLNAWHAMQEGFYMLGNVLVGILYILPIGLLLFGIVYVVRKSSK
jgi:Domain of unknown function (DUF4349)